MTWFDSFDDFNDFDEDCKDGFRMGNGHYLPGTRKCSVCKDFKEKTDFNKEQAAKPATKRICNDCGAPLPSDLNQLTVEALKNELHKRKVPIPKGNKSVLVNTLSLAIGNQPPPPPPPKPPSQPPFDDIIILLDTIFLYSEYNCFFEKIESPKEKLNNFM